MTKESLRCQASSLSGPPVSAGRGAAVPPSADRRNDMTSMLRAAAAAGPGGTYDWSQTAASTGSWDAVVTAICAQPAQSGSGSGLSTSP